MECITNFLDKNLHHLADYLLGLHFLTDTMGFCFCFLSFYPIIIQYAFLIVTCHLFLEKFRCCK